MIDGKRMNVHNKESSGQPSVATDGFKARIDGAKVHEDIGIAVETKFYCVTDKSVPY